MSHPYRSAGHKNDPKWLGGLERATGGGVSDGRRGNNTSKTFRDTDESVKTTSRFLPKYDFDYDPTGGHHTSMMTDFGASHEVEGMKSRLNDSDQSTIRQSQDDADIPMNSQLRKRGGRVKKRADGGDVPMPRPDTRKDADYGWGKTISLNRQGQPQDTNPDTRGKWPDGHVDDWLPQKRTTSRASGGRLVDDKGDWLSDGNQSGPPVTARRGVRQGLDDSIDRRSRGGRAKK